MDVDSMTVKELKQELKARGLKISGNKAILKERLSEAVAQSDTQTSSEPVSTEVDNVDSTIADFEDYINEEHKRLTENREKEQDETEQEPAKGNDNEVNIDDIINKNNATIDAEEEKSELLQSDFDVNTSTPQQPSTVTVSDFDTTPQVPTSSNPTALNHKDKVQERMNRFGTNPLSNTDKIESRKRRFAAMNENNPESSSPSAKKQKVDKEAERKRIFDRAQKFGTALPKNFKLSKEESEMIHKEKIDRAKRFGTEHLLPKAIQKAKMDSKKAERMKRFNTNEKGKIIDNETEETKPKNIAKLNEPEDKLKLNARKLRFGTLTDGDKKKQRQERFAADLTLDEMAQNHKAKNKGNGMKKKFTPRQQKNNQRIQKFRNYKKNNKQFNNNNNQRGRGFGNNNRGRFNNNNGRGGRRGGNFGYRNNKQFNNNNGGFNNRRGGFRGNNNGRGGYNNNYRKNFNNNNNGNFNKNNNRNQGQGNTQVEFSQADLQKIQERKQRFTAIPDF